MRFINRKMIISIVGILSVYTLGYFHFVFNFLQSIPTFLFSLPLWTIVFFLGVRTGHAINEATGKGNEQKNDGGKRPPSPPIIIDLKKKVKEEEKVLVPA